MTPAFRVFGTDSTSGNSSFSASVTTGATMFPFTGAYLVFAGLLAEADVAVAELGAAFRHDCTPT